MDKLKKVVVILVVITLLKYPVGMQPLPMSIKFGLNYPAGGFLDESARPTVLGILSNQEMGILKAISDADMSVRETVQVILEMPNLSRKQIAEQKAAWDTLKRESGIIRTG